MNFKIKFIIFLFLVSLISIILSSIKIKIDNFMDFSCTAEQNKNYHPEELLHKSRCQNIVIVEKIINRHPMFFAENGDEDGPYFSKDYVRYYYLGVSPEGIQLDLDYDLSDQASTQVNVRLVFFDIKNIGKSIGVYHNKVSATQIIAIGELVVDGKVKKRTTQKGTSKTISTSTLVVADDGTFNQQTASIALKRVCENIIKDLL